MGWTRKHLLTMRELDASEIVLLIDTAASLQEIATREIKKVPALRGKTIVNLFYEPSTRTRTSFEIAEKRLSADTLNIAVAASSVLKGETLVDAFTIREHKQRIEGLKVTIVGDLLHSRVLRSNVLLLTMLGAEVWVCGPSTLVPVGIERLGV